MSLIEVHNLRYAARTSARAGFAAGRRDVLKGVSLQIEEGTSTALLGESGSGKTTLARCIVGLLEPDSGTITYCGTNLYPEAANRRSIGTGIQMLFQDSGSSLDPCMTVLDSLAEGIMSRKGMTEGDVAEAEGLVSSVGMPRDCLGLLPSQLSGGQRQRIALARVLSASPRLLVLDEPTSALDVLTSASLLQLLKTLQAAQGFTLLFITHQMETALSYCDRVAVLHDGVIAEEGTAGEVRRNPRHPYTQQLLKDSWFLP